MKLIKLSSETSGEEFENVFNVDIPIEPFSKVGLVSASVMLSNKIITIDITNNLFEMRTLITSGGSPRVYANVNLNTGSYTQGEFVQEMTRALNSALNNDVESSGSVQWRASVTNISPNPGKLMLEMRRASYNVDLLETDLSVEKNLNYTAGANPTYAKGNAGTTFDAFGVTKKFFTNGCGEAIMIVDALTTKFAFGLITTAPTELLQISDYDYVVYTEAGDPNYIIKTPAGDVVSSVAQVDNAQIIIELTSGKLNFVLKVGAAQTIIHTVDDWSYETSYHLGFNVISAAGVVNSLKWASDPFLTEIDNVLVYPSHSLGAPLIYDALALTTPAAPGIASISFKQKPQTGLYLGFDLGEYQMAQSGQIWNLQADQQLSQAISFTDLMVELPSFPNEMMSFDGSIGRKRAIVAYIPSLEINHSELIYNAAFPIMIDINNSFKYNLNSVKVRLLTSAPHEVQVESASIVIMISSK